MFLYTEEGYGIPGSTVILFWLEELFMTKMVNTQALYGGLNAPFWKYQTWPYILAIIAKNLNQTNKIISNLCLTQLQLKKP